MAPMRRLSARTVRDVGDPTTPSPVSRTIFLGTNPVTFDEAEAFCAKNGRHLASIHSTAEQARAAVLCDSVPHYFVFGDVDSSPFAVNASFGCWVGMAYFFGQWIWNDG